MPIEHGNIVTEADLHEPKGVSTATAGQVYEANGDGSSGTWVEAAGVVRGLLTTKPSDAVTISTIGTTAKAFLGFATVSTAANITASATTDDFTVTDAGDYQLMASISFSTAAGADAGDYTFEFRKNGVATGFGCDREMSGTSDTGTVAFFGELEGLIATDVISIWIESDEAGDTDDISVNWAQFAVTLLQGA